VLGGGVIRSGEQLIAPVREAVCADVLGPAASARIVASALGDHVGVVGAAAIVYGRDELDVRAHG
jgi:glucokinase